MIVNALTLNQFNETTITQQAAKQALAERCNDQEIVVFETFVKISATYHSSFECILLLIGCQSITNIISKLKRITFPDTFLSEFRLRFDFLTKVNWQL